MIYKTLRFGELDLLPNDVVTFPNGIFGFPELHRYCLVDPGEDTLIVWLQSLEDLGIAFPVLEPKIFKQNYIVRLSPVELKDLKLVNLASQSAAVFTILTIPQDVTQMSANLKAPLVVNLNEQVGKQVVLQENEYTLKHFMFKELKTHIVTIESSKLAQQASYRKNNSASLISLNGMTASTQVKQL